jgi:hypothetical protein
MIDLEEVKIWFNLTVDLNKAINYYEVITKSCLDL